MTSDMNNICEACGESNSIFVEMPSRLRKGSHKLCLDCYDNEQVVYCYVMLGKEPKYAMYVNIQNDSHTRKKLKELKGVRVGSVLSIRPLCSNKKVPKEIMHYTSKGRNKFVV